MVTSQAAEGALVPDFTTGLGARQRLDIPGLVCLSENTYKMRLYSPSGGCVKLREKDRVDLAALSRLSTVSV